MHTGQIILVDLTIIMRIDKMNKRKIKRIGCLVVALIFLGIPTVFIGDFFYRMFLKRNYVKIDGYKTITIWGNYIIFDRYWYPFYPKDNYILADNRGEYYILSFTITQDSVLGIWSDGYIEVFGMDEFKAIEIYEERDAHEDWANRYSFKNATESRQDSLRLEVSFELWFPEFVHTGTYIYKSGDVTITQDFGRLSYSYPEISRH